MGGSDDPSNLIELTVEEHAEAHRKLYEEHGLWQDKVAWQGLAGLIGHDEIMREMWDARKGEGNTFYGKKHTEETKRKISESRKGKGTGPRDNTNYLIANKGKNKGKTPWNAGKTGAQRKRTPEEMASFSKVITYEGVEYPSLSAASRATGLSPYKLKIATSK
tara:strand:+ start:2853 stop:3341 length:489 start_codon:yes stop_codon:yes gene_type:complete